MQYLRSAVVVTSSLLLLTGCSVFYPNWGATGLPEPTSAEPTPTETVTVTAEPEPTDIDSEEPQPEPTASETESAEPEIVQENAEVTIIMAIPEPDYGVLSVVAEVLGVTENDGVCGFRFIGSNQEQTDSNPAIPSSDYTVCSFEVPLADLPSGNGVVTVSYESSRHIGRSAATSVVIP